MCVASQECKVAGRGEGEDEGRVVVGEEAKRQQLGSKKDQRVPTASPEEEQERLEGEVVVVVRLVDEEEGNDHRAARQQVEAAVLVGEVEAVVEKDPGLLVQNWTMS